MQYSLPQFVEVEDTIFWKLTLKQFLILLAGGILCYFYWSIFKASIIFFLLALPTVGFFTILALGKFNGRSLISNFPALVKYYTSPRMRIFKRSGEPPAITIKKVVKKKDAALEKPVFAESRLKKLAYLLDQKTAEEERLIHSGKIHEKWLNQI